MKRLSCIAVFVTFSQFIFAQDAVKKIADSINQEGLRLYQSEMSSWNGTDIFLEKFPNQRNNIGGYFSYAENNIFKSVFYSNAEKPRVLATIIFDSTFSTTTATVSDKARSFSPIELEYYALRNIGLDLINNDTLFKSYKNTNLNMIPLVGEKYNQVYVLTGPQVSGVVVFGNDYLLTFDKNNKLLEKKQLHQNIIPVEYGKTEEVVFGTMHNHAPESGDFISATDICTLRLYQKMAKWKQHMVISQHYVSIWNCETNRLTAIPRDEWEKQNRR